MPDTWDPVVYRERAKAWREKAATLSGTDPNRAPCLEIAEGYERLATHLEQRCGLEKQAMTLPEANGSPPDAS